MIEFPPMIERGYRRYLCPECACVMWIHLGDGDETEVFCNNCEQTMTAGEVRHPEGEEAEE